MTSHLRRCRRCGQTLLDDARCCPHCAIPRPIRRRLLYCLFVGAAALAALGAGLRGRSEVTGNALAAAPYPSTWSFVTALVDEPRAASACRQRGGTLVWVPGPWASATRRCATSFDERGPP